MRIPIVLLALVAFVTSMQFNIVFAAEFCGSLTNSFGPFDYRTATSKQRAKVEGFHFTEDVEALRSGQSSTTIGKDISYTLRVFPNHPRALMAMAKLAKVQKTQQPAGSPYAIECWFERAFRFQSDDGSVRMVYGIALLLDGKLQPAIVALEKAKVLIPKNSNVYYNLGLAYFEAGDYDNALANAKIAYEMGFPLPGLRNMLKGVNRWQ